MQFTTEYRSRQAALVTLFRDTFAVSEGAEEGAVIGAFVERLLGETSAEDLRVFAVLDGDTPIGCICFSRLDYAEDPRRVMLLSPVAVATVAQGSGLGQALIRHGLNVLRGEGIDIAITYGDSAYYGKVGFRPLTEEIARAPLPLSHPEGWIGQSLKSSDVGPLKGPSRPVPALDDPALW
ncbi:GNAT family N-acetyltransferase [Nioella aestuarii]|uniref:GNAT family N-acetyltransferase n=1 Tax=Nioella aestuarii TaxID=1662864 RepID=UPI003D7F5895